MDRVKTILQNASAAAPKHASVSATRLAADIVSTEGPLALFRGLATPLLAAGPQSALLFASYSGFLSLWPSQNASLKATAQSACGQGAGRSDAAMTAAGITRHLSAGAFSGVLATAILTPAELTKVVLQLDRGRTPRYRSSVHCLMERVRTLGLQQGAYLGTHVMLWREIVGYALYFGVYQACRAALVPWWQTDAARAREMQLSVNIEGDPAWAQLLAGGMAGALSWAVIFPLDAVKTLIQSGDGSMGILQAARQLRATRGWRGMFSGFQVCMVRGFIVNAVTFWGYESCVSIINGAR